MDFDAQLDALFWRCGVYPRLTGKQYLTYILKCIHSGTEISPDLLTETAKAFGKNRNSIYSALRVVRSKITNHYRTVGNACPPIHRNSFYDFLYWFYQEVEHQLYP